MTDLFNVAYLRSAVGESVFAARDNLANCDTVDITVNEYCEYVMSDRAGVDSLIYGKDLPCPPAWTDALERVLPTHWLANRGDDMFALLPDILRPEVTLAYHGLAGTSTAGHFDICSSVGHNIMVWTDSPDSCAYWFMVASRDRDAARAFWLANGGNLDHDNHLLSLDVLATADFPIYVVEQRLGDFVLVSPDGAHQVINAGGASMKVAWNRVPPICLRFAHERVLPKLRAQGKQEVYRIKAAAWFGLQRSVELVERGELPPTRHTVLRLEELRRLVADNWAAELVDESDLRQLAVGPLRNVQPDAAVGGSKSRVAKAAYSSSAPSRGVDDETPASLCARVTTWCGASIAREDDDGGSHMRSCDFCRCDLWNRFWHCTVCARDSDDYDLCLSCVAVGRGCSDDHFPQFALYETLAPGEVEALLALAASTIERVRRLVTKPTAATLAVRRVRAAQLDAAVRERALSAVAADASNAHLLRASSCGMLCHQCRTYRPFELCVPCRCSLVDGNAAARRSNGAGGESTCSLVYCEDCLWNVYHVTPMSCLTQLAWCSPFCAGACRCAQCCSPDVGAPREPVMCELPFQLLHATGMLDAARLGVADTLPADTKLVNPPLWFDAQHEANRREVQRRHAIQVAADAAKQPEAQPKVLSVLNDGAEFRPRAAAAEQMGLSPLSSLFVRNVIANGNNGASSGAVIAVLPPRRRSAMLSLGNSADVAAAVVATATSAESTVVDSLPRNSRSRKRPMRLSEVGVERPLLAALTSLTQSPQQSPRSRSDVAALTSPPPSQQPPPPPRSQPAPPPPPRVKRPKLRNEAMRLDEELSVYMRRLKAARARALEAESSSLEKTLASSRTRDAESSLPTSSNTPARARARDAESSSWLPTTHKTPARARARHAASSSLPVAPKTRAEWMMRPSVPCVWYASRGRLPNDLIVDVGLLWAPMSDGRWFPCTRVVVDEALERERETLLRDFSSRFVTKHDRRIDARNDVLPALGVDLVQFFGTRKFEWVHRYRRFDLSDKLSMYNGPRDSVLRLGGELKTAVDSARRFATNNIRQKDCEYAIRAQQT